MRKLITSAFILLFSGVVSAQDSDYVRPQQPKLLSTDRVSATITAGAGVSFLNSSTPAYGTFVAPKINYQLSPKFQLQLGFMHYELSGAAFYPLNSSEALINRSNKAVSGNLMMVGGNYQLNKKVGINGSVMLDVTGNNSNNAFKAASLGLDYKVSEHSTISVQTILSGGNGNYYNNPFMNPAGSSGNMFGTGFNSGFSAIH